MTLPRATPASSRRMLIANRSSRAKKRVTAPENRTVETMRRPLSGGGCWCQLPAAHDWPGRDEGAPHPRRAMWAGLARQPYDQGPCLSEHCDRQSEPGVWFCCGLCAEAADFRRETVVHADPCNERSGVRVGLKGKRK